MLPPTGLFKRVGSGWQESQGDSRVGCNELSIVQKAFETLFGEIIKEYKKNNEISEDKNMVSATNFRGYMKEKIGSISGLSGGYTIHIDVNEDNFIETEELGNKKCC